MLQLDILKLFLAKYFLRAIKAYKARRKYFRLFYRGLLIPVNLLIMVFPLGVDILQRGIIFVASRLPLFVRNGVYYLASPFFTNNLRTRLYLRPRITLNQFFRELKEENANYVVLRWFESLPRVDEGEDIDILVAEKDVEKLKSLLTPFPTAGQAFDVYTDTGTLGLTFKGLPYYPRHLAKNILSSRKIYKDSFFVPGKKEYFYSLAYHAIYHKSEASGLPLEAGSMGRKSDHNYQAYLIGLAKELGYSVEIDMKNLHEFLSEQSWSPSLDTLRKLSAKNEFLSSLLSGDENVNLSDGELMVFVLRDWVLQYEKMDFILDKLEDKKLQTLLVHYLSDKERRIASEALRGGKWDRGPFHSDGGKPAVFVVCFDYHPVPATEKEKKKQPYVKNRNIFIKKKIRNELNDGMLWFSWANCIHAADDEIEAWDYIQKVIPTHEKKIRNDVQIRRELYQTTYPVLKTVRANNTRAKVEVIDYLGFKGVKKTFKYGTEKFLQRETFVHKKFSEYLDYIPEVLEVGENYLITKYYKDTLQSYSDIKRNTILSAYAKDILKILFVFYREGYALIDFHPGNLLLTADKKIKIFDFEFIYEYKNKPATFKQSYDIKGLPANFDGDLPHRFEAGGRSYFNTWRFILGPLKRYSNYLDSLDEM